MYITNLEEILPVLRLRLEDYLVTKTELRKGEQKRFKCFAHDEDTPSMSFVPNSRREIVHCFGCNRTFDIFSACSTIEGLPDAGPGWISETIPHLAELLEIPIKLGEPTPQDKYRAKLFKLASDITDALAAAGDAVGYAKGRRWDKTKLTHGSIEEESLVSFLVERGWGIDDINSSLMVRTTRSRVFGEDRLTFVIKDHRGRPCGFISRVTTGEKPKYVNTPDTELYQKGKFLLGLDVALKTAKTQGLYIVEGPGDLAQLHRVGIHNAVALCGVALTANHMALLKMLGVRKLFFCLDWDQAGTIATERVLKEEFISDGGFSCWVIKPPVGTPVGDVDELLCDEERPAKFLALEKETAFRWLLSVTSEKITPDQLCRDMLPIIAAEPTAVRREILMKELSEHTGISYLSISSDVKDIKDHRHEEKKRKLKGSVDKYLQEVLDNPNNIQSALASHEYEIHNIERSYKSDLIGVNYQLARYNGLQERKNINENNGYDTEFKFEHFIDFASTFSGGMPVTEGALFYIGGRAHAGKSALVQHLGIDVVLSDENALVVMHTTDDSYAQTEPRLKTIVSKLMYPNSHVELTPGMAANPYRNILTPDQWELYNLAEEKLVELLSEERLVLIDSEDGSTLGALERNLRYLRQRYPDKKILCICDNTHRYRDFMHLESRTRMTQISDTQKYFTGKYRMCMIATVEYRKNQPQNTNRLVLPIDDDIADARALTYNPNVIIHVYNDLNDRGDNAELFWHKNGEKMPKLLLHVSKNKLKGTAGDLHLLLDKDTLTLSQPAPKLKDVMIDMSQGYTIQADEYTEYKEN